MTKHKIARKVASNSSPPTNNRIMLGDWIREAHPEVWEQYCAIKDLEEASELPDPTLEHMIAHYKAKIDLENQKIKFEQDRMSKLIAEFKHGK